MKRLIVCCDGTWDRPDNMAGGKPCPSNVTKLALAVAEQGSDGVEQRVYYHRGVGTTRWQRIRGGMMGFGLDANLRDAYRFLVDVFEPGDQLFLFGFSRGAYTARSLAGMIRNCGILRPEHADRISDAFTLYRDRGARTHPRGLEATLFRRTYAHETPIRFIGVWDTVGALGIPLSGLRWVNFLNRRYQFHDVALSTRVEAAFQALAVDEKRNPFVPAVWQQQPEARGQQLEQVWFTGCHCDVGGGEPDSELADIALLWMADRTREYGLTLRPGVLYHGTPDAAATVKQPTFPVDPDALGRIHESRKGMYRLLRAAIRPIGKVDQLDEYLSSTAQQRHRDPEAAYAPANLRAYLEQSWAHTMQVDIGQELLTVATSAPSPGTP